MARFVPRCPGCGYDLRGLDDGPCPECGRGFKRAALLEDWGESLWRRELTVEQVRAVGRVAAGLVIATQACCYDPGGGCRGPGLGTAVNLFWLGMALLALWLVVDRRRVMTGPGWPSAVAGVPAARLVLTSPSIHTGLLALLPLALFTGAWALTRGRRASPLLWAWGGAVAVPCAPRVVEWLVEGKTWSRVADPRGATVQVYAQYPLRYDELAWGLGPAAALVVGLVGAGVVMDVRRWIGTQRSRRADAGSSQRAGASADA